MIEREDCCEKDCLGVSYLQFGVKRVFCAPFFSRSDLNGCANRSGLTTDVIQPIVFSHISHRFASCLPAIPNNLTKLTRSLRQKGLWVPSSGAGFSKWDVPCLRSLVCGLQRDQHLCLKSESKGEVRPADSLLLTLSAAL